MNYTDLITLLICVQ